MPAQNATAEIPVQAAAPGIEETIQSLGLAAERFVKAFNQKDAAAIAALFTPDGEIVGTDGGIIAGRRQIEGYHKCFVRPLPIIFSCIRSSKNT